MEKLPEQFQPALEAARIEVKDWPTRAMLRDAGTEPGHTLLGLYQGRPAISRSVEDSGYLPDVIYLFQREIEAICSSEAELEEQVRITVLHELGHHFGLNDENLDELGYG